MLTYGTVVKVKALNDLLNGKVGKISGIGMILPTTVVYIVEFEELIEGYRSVPIPQENLVGEYEIPIYLLLNDNLKNKQNNPSQKQPTLIYNVN
jgi:hypothetical protein